jgi:hypothetical protein
VFFKNKIDAFIDLKKKIFTISMRQELVFFFNNPDLKKKNY